MHALDLGEAKLGVRRKVWTREEAARLSEMFPGERYELIEGELFNKMGQNPPHAYILALLTKIFGTAFPGRIRVQSAIALPDPYGRQSEPEPDLILQCQEDQKFFAQHPGPEDIALLVEVADTTFPFDRTTKYRLYARTGIREYWIVDVPNKRLVVCRGPQGDEFRSVEILSGQDTVSPLATPEFRLRVEQLFA